MLKSKTAVFTLAGMTAIVLSAGLLMTNKAQSQQGEGKTRTASVLKKGDPTDRRVSAQPTEKELDDAATPVVDLDSAEMAAADKNSPRGRKNARFNKAGFVIHDPTNVGEMIMYNDPRTNISDLPVDASDVIAVGRVVGAEAFLSDDKSGVYSEFSVRLSRVLKNTPDTPVADGETVVTERLGGRVRYPSGKIVRYRVAGEGSPGMGEEYLFFLKRAAEGNYRIVTAFELRGNKVVALDGSRIAVRGETIFDKHNGKERGAFIDEVDAAIRGSNSHKNTTEVTPNE